MTKLVVPKTGELTPTRGNALSRWLGRWMLSRKGWTIEGEVANVPRAVVIAAPHTSNWDGYYAIGGMMAIGLRLSIMAKDSLFKWYIGWFFDWIGFLRVNRNAPGGFVEKCAHTLKESKGLWMVIPAEGTRKKAKKWKSGFHRIATLAEAPMLPISIDFEKKQFVIGKPRMPTGDYQSDLNDLLDFYADCAPHTPELLSLPLVERRKQRESLSA